MMRELFNIQYGLHAIQSPPWTVSSNNNNNAKKKIQSDEKQMKMLSVSHLNLRVHYLILLVCVCLNILRNPLSFRGYISTYLLHMYTLTLDL